MTPKFIVITILIWTIWFATSFVFNGMDYIFVITLKKLNINYISDDTFTSIIKACCVQLFVPFAALGINFMF